MTVFYPVFSVQKKKGLKKITFYSLKIVVLKQPGTIKKENIN